MTRQPPIHPDQLALDWESDPAIRQRIEEVAAGYAERQATWWRLRLMLIETVMMGSLVVAAGFAVGQPTTMVLRSGGIVAVACLASGMMLVGLSALCAMALSRLRQWWAQ